MWDLADSIFDCGPIFCGRSAKVFSTYFLFQTDPNWSNFYFGRHPTTGELCLILLDFGASRSYSKKFVDQYMRIIRAAYDGNRDDVRIHPFFVCLPTVLPATFGVWIVLYDFIAFKSVLLLKKWGNIFV